MTLASDRSYLDYSDRVAVDLVCIQLGTKFDLPAARYVFSQIHELDFTGRVHGLDGQLDFTG